MTAIALQEEKDFYALLGVARDASREDIKRAFRELSRIFHPDSNYYDDIVNEPASEKHVTIFKQISSAYETLTDDDKRRIYDNSLRSSTLRAWEDVDISFDNSEIFAKNWNELSKEVNGGKSRRNTFGQFGSSPRVEEPLNTACSEQIRPVSECLYLRRGLFGRLRRMFRI